MMAAGSGKFRLSSGWLIVMSSGAALVLPAVFAQGMFVDGTIYASIARNLAIGKGTWWLPQYSGIISDIGTAGPGFFEHPPMQFWLQSGLFRIFGDHLWVDKLFVLLVFIANAILICAVCRKLFPDGGLHRHVPWLALVFWLLTPTIPWSIAHNMLENTMGFFCLCAIWCVLRAFESPGKVLWLSLSSLFVFFGFLTKGPVALFPLAAPFLWWVLYRPSALPFGYVLIPGVVFALLLTLLMGYTPARYFILDYWNIQVMQSIQAKRELAERSPIRHLHLVVRLLVQSVNMFLVAGIVAGIGWRYKHKMTQVSKASWFLLLVVASATLPMLISIKQRTYYLTPAIPFLAIGLAGYVYVFLPPLQDVWKKRIRTTLAVFCLVIFIVAFSFMGKRTRDAEELAAIDLFLAHVPEKNFVAVCDQMETGSRIGAYMERYGQWEPTIEMEQCAFAMTHMTEDTCAQTFTSRLEKYGWIELGKSGNYRLWKNTGMTD